MSILAFIGLCLAFFVIAALYSSVGFGGGSSYLAILALVMTSFFEIRSTALVCNLVVVTGSSYWYWKRQQFSLRQFLPFVLTSIPLAFIGASFRLQERSFFLLLSLALMGSAAALLYQAYSGKKQPTLQRSYPAYASYLLGGGIGLLSGLVGIGGGIFLAPVLHHLRWEDARKIAALASFFILANSVAGIGGLILGGTFTLPWINALGLVLAVFTGGQVGVRISLNTFTSNTIKLLTALLVLLVGLRVFLFNSVWAVTT